MIRAARKFAAKLVGSSSNLSVAAVNSCDYENIIRADAEKIVAIVPTVPIASLEYRANRSTVRLDPEALETARI